ncbi:hypothetical protein H8356DRAFT_1334457 [Neocallimastix lanati (nom. inval.)]|nr:hypothetical protein H8356DRAFT_1334457 [Neocallimastix sp. JGI-2020a]
MELDTVSLYIKPGNYDRKDYAIMINSFFHINLNELVHIAFVESYQGLGEYLYIEFAQPASKTLDCQAIQTEIPLSENSNQLFFIVDSNCVSLDTNDIQTILEEVTVTGTKGITKIETYNDNDQYIISVTDTNLDPLFNNQYIDPERSYYLVYSNPNEISFDQRKQNTFESIKKNC